MKIELNKLRWIYKGGLPTNNPDWYEGLIFPDQECVPYRVNCKRQVAGVTLRYVDTSTGEERSNCFEHVPFDRFELEVIE